MGYWNHANLSLIIIQTCLDVIDDDDKIMMTMTRMTTMTATMTMVTIMVEVTIIRLLSVFCRWGRRRNQEGPLAVPV